MSKKKSSGVSALEAEEAEVKPENIEEESASSDETDGEGAGGAGLLSGTFGASSEPESEGGGDASDSTGTIMVTSLWPSRLIVNAPSGNRYEWPRAGATIEVDPDDIPFLAAKNRSVRACCGSEGERRYFDI